MLVLILRLNLVKGALVMHINLRRSLLLCLMLSVGCAERVKDIDRTLGNLIEKAHLSGDWYMLQTVTDVPTTSWFTFIGETSRMERVRWVVQRNLLVAYRAYPRIRGGDAPTTNPGAPNEVDNPVAAYPILAHVDIRRDYNAQTGEQSNVLGENQMDRLWHERDYIRVDWGNNQVTNFEFIAPTRSIVNAGYFEEQEQGGEDAVHKEFNEAGGLTYFDILGKLFVEPDYVGCIYTYWGLAAEDCTAGEIAIRSSFSKAPEVSQYEPFHYSDQLMSRFGFFRTEYFTYDLQRGITDQGRRYLIERHNIYQRSFDESGAVIPIPERQIRTIPYYLSNPFPDVPSLYQVALETVAQWNGAAKTGVQAARETTEPIEQDIFVLCRNPVTEEDPDACGAVGFSPRMGDLRYSTLYWVDPYTQAGLLGYGPSAVDPLTGEIIAGKAYVYGAAVNEWATHAIDVLRFFDGDLSIEDLARGNQFLDQVRATANESLERKPPSDALERMSMRRHQAQSRDRKAHRTPKRDLSGHDARLFSAKLEAASTAVQVRSQHNPEVAKAMDRFDGANQSKAMARLSTLQNPFKHKERHRQRKKARAAKVDFKDYMTPDIAGLVEAYSGRDDYAQIFEELRADIFAAVAEHEMGHTVGLRHNFQGSYDSLNYHDEYWDLRSENLGSSDTLADVYRMNQPTPAQQSSQMRQYQYSSIMDYGYSWHNDLKGLGKYDRAAFIFGYTAGSYEDCPPEDDACKSAKPGYVEVFDKRKDALGSAGDILTNVEGGYSYDDSGLPSINVLERYHYTTIAQSLPSLDDLGDSGRRFMNYQDYLDEKNSATPPEGGRAVRVPYLFCSDEWESGLVSCHAFDQGADPFEIVQTRINRYRTYYAFDNFRRDNPFFDFWWPLDTYFFRVFLPISDVFQSWYVAPYGDDPLFDQMYDLAINSGFNLLAEVLSTPRYGEYCESTDGRMIHLSTDPVLQGDTPYGLGFCKDPGDRSYLRPGDGRRAFSIYDSQQGYYFADKVLESGHYWASLAALWAILDPEAYVLGADGDAGTYAISFYDWFGDELTKLMNDLLVNDFTAFAPQASFDATQGGLPVMRLDYPRALTLTSSQNGAPYDPETGQRITDTSGGDTVMCGTCEASRECTGYTGRYGSVFCETLGDDTVCLKDCTNDANSCPSGTVCTQDVCQPESGECTDQFGPCSDDNPFGACDVGRCIDGQCVDIDSRRVVEAEPTFSISSDIFWYGFLFTTASYSTLFNDQLNVFRTGSRGRVVPEDESSQMVSFTNPMSGVTYGAVQTRCPELENLSYAGPTGECGACEDNAQCSGYTGNYGATFCQSIAGSDNSYCLQDCTEDPNICGLGRTCDGIGNCVPDTGICPAVKPCSLTSRFGQCPESQTCVEGECVRAYCQFGFDGEPGSIRMIRRGNELAKTYEAALDVWYRNNDASIENDLARAYYRSKSDLTSFTDLLETLVATYDIFGRIY